MDDILRTVEASAQGYVTEKKSKFISFVFPVKTVEEAMEKVDLCRKKYYDARHVCWAYMLGWEHDRFRSNDDGEPSGTAGRPILGQINSHELTDVLVVVIRYFGGTLLGTSGLIKAYKAAAAEAIAQATIIEKTVDDCLELSFEYPQLNEVMRLLKQFDEVTWQQLFGESCRMQLQIRRSLTPQLVEKLSAIYGVNVKKS